MPSARPTLEQRIREALDARDDVRIATTESCTGGTIAARVTSVSGSSAYFVGGVVSYANDVKERLLRVPAEILANPGAVSEECARAMVEGVCGLLGATHAVSTTGIAGPSGGTARKPVGLVYIGILTPKGTRVERHVFSGDRAAIITAASDRALELLLESIHERGTR